MTGCKVKKTDADWRVQLGGCGWPRDSEAINREVVERVVDETNGMLRAEVRCNNCGSHLGGERPDGSRPTGERFCLNSAAIDFAPE